MRRSELLFDRPASRQAAAPPESRGLARDDVRLMVTTPDVHEHARFRDLPRLLEPGGVLVVNTSGTLPASLPATGRVGTFPLNLATDYGGGLWLSEPRRSASEPGPLAIEAGERIEVAGPSARFISPYPGLPRLWFVRAEGDVRTAMERAGEPIRYGYLREPYPLIAAYQTIFATQPGSAEMPSAARPFTLRVLDALRARSIGIVPVVLDTAHRVNAARREGRPVIAVGTTVVRALESAWDGRWVLPITGFTRLLVHPERPVRTIDGILTGLHDPLASHLAMLHAIADAERVRSAYLEAVRAGYLWHEFGDSHLIFS